MLTKIIRKIVAVIVVATAMLAGLLPASAQTACPRNLNGLTNQQFDNAYQSLAGKVDRELNRTGRTYYINGVADYFEATALVEVTRINTGVVEHVMCVARNYGYFAELRTSGTKVYLFVRIFWDY